MNYTDAGCYKIVARNPLGRQQAQATVVVDTNAHITPTPQPRKSRMADSNTFSSMHQTPPNSVSVNFSPSSSIATPNEQSNDYFNVHSTGSSGCNSITQNSVKSMESLRPCVIEDLSSKTVKIGDFETLECRIEGSGGVARWRLNGADLEKKMKPIGPSNTRFVTRQFGEVYRLRIIDIDVYAIGDYECDVTNSVGSITLKCSLTTNQEYFEEPSSEVSPYKPAPQKNGAEKMEPMVRHHARSTIIDAPRWSHNQVEPSFEIGLKDVVVDEGEVIVLNVKVNGNPKPDVRFFYDDERFSSEPENGIIITEEDNNYKLILEDSNQDDDGNYSCLGKP